ncbi:hypothetical protein GIB67_013947, partial [Kingdonia uniflora]
MENLVGCLTTLYLYEDQLSGSIPPKIRKLKSFVDLQVNTNNLSCTIPVSLDNLSDLSTLYLHHNKLSGFIPSGTITLGIGNLKSLFDLQISTNNLSGIIPASLDEPEEVGELRFEVVGSLKNGDTNQELRQGLHDESPRTGRIPKIRPRVIGEGYGCTQLPNKVRDYPHSSKNPIVGSRRGCEKMRFFSQLEDKGFVKYEYRIIGEGCPVVRRPKNSEFGHGLSLVMQRIVEEDEVIKHVKLTRAEHVESTRHDTNSGTQ